MPLPLLWSRTQFWGSYYLRWWLTKQILGLCGRGFFRFHPAALAWYYRLLGAKIGRNCLIHEYAQLDAHDLLEFGDDTLVGDATVTPFGVLSGGFELSPIKLGREVTISQASWAVEHAEKNRLWPMGDAA